MNKYIAKYIIKNCIRMHWIVKQIMLPILMVMVCSWW